MGLKLNRGAPHTSDRIASDIIYITALFGQIFIGEEMDLWSIIHSIKKDQ